MRQQQHQHQPRHPERESVLCLQAMPCQYRVFSVPLSSSCSSASHPSKQRGQDRQCENDDVHGESPSDGLAPVRHSYKRCWHQPASKLPPCRVRGQGRGGTREAPILYMQSLSLFLVPRMIRLGQQHSRYIHRQTNFAGNINKRDRARRRSSARACAFRFVSTIRFKLKS